MGHFGQISAVLPQIFFSARVSIYRNVHGQGCSRRGAVQCRDVAANLRRSLATEPGFTLFVPRSQHFLTKPIRNLATWFSAEVDANLHRLVFIGLY